MIDGARTMPLDSYFKEKGDIYVNIWRGKYDVSYIDCALQKRSKLHKRLGEKMKVVTFPAVQKNKADRELEEIADQLKSGEASEVVALIVMRDGTIDERRIVGGRQIFPSRRV